MSESFTPVKKLQLYGTFPTTPGPQGPQGPAGHTPVKGTDYFTEEDKTEMVNAVLAEHPISTSGGYTDISNLRQMTGATLTRSGNAIIIARTLEGGVTATSVITLDDNDRPVTVTTDGVECVLTWEGFDE